VQRGDVGHRAQRDEIQQREEIRLGATGEVIALAQRADGRDRYEECDSDGREVSVRGARLALVQAVGIDECRRDRKLCRAFVMVDDYAAAAWAIASASCAMAPQSTVTIRLLPSPAIRTSASPEGP
jgi:hypothetical protein